MPDRSLPGSIPSAADHFAEWLARSGGSRDDFEELARTHPQHAAELRRLFEHWLALAEVFARAGIGLGADTTVSFAERLKERYGPGVDPAIALEEQRTDEPPTSLLMGRLGEKTLNRSRYQLKGELARGGMGAILKVWDEDLRRSLAMKVILGMADGATGGETPPVDRRLLARFLEEAQVTGQLDHPGIVPVHELGLDAEGRVFFTMKLVKGRDLRTIFDLVCDELEGWNETRALGVILKVCEAMAYAHAKGVVHRDLKPANVMVGNFGEVYVMDWGLARVLGRKDAHDLRLRDAGTNLTSVKTERRAEREDAPDSPLFTMDGDIVGTPAYMPPEQALGMIDKLSPRADVYSIGAMLYQLLVRQMPYVPPGARLSSRMVLTMVVHGPPPSIGSIRKDVPAELVAIVERAMAREPEQRYRDTLELADDLRAYLEHRVVKAYQTGALAELRKWVERNKGLAAAIAAAIVLAVGGLGAVGYIQALGRKAANVQRSIAQANEQRALDSEQVATARADDVLRLSALQKLDDLVAEADRLWPAIPENVPEYEEWLLEARELVAQLPDHERKLSELRARSVPWTEEEQARHRAEHPKLAELESAKRHREHDEKLAAAMESSEAARDLAPEEVGVDLASLPATANDVNSLAWPLIDPDRKNWGGEAKGLVLARRAVELGVELSAAERAGIRDSLAWALFANGRFDEAVAEEERALEESPADRKDEFEGYLDRLKKKIEEEIDPAKEAEREKHAAEIEARIAELEAEISKRPEWSFADAQDKWWHNQLEKLVEGVKAFADPEKGLASNGTSATHGWGVEKRAEFARTIAQHSLSGGDASTKWAEAITSIANAAECPLYGGLRTTPQLGLLPIGRDPESGLWEFAHLQTGEPAVRGPDGKLILKEETGLVLVLLPGGTFQMGAQSQDPNAPNYDPQARSDEGPVHEVTLSPFFMSKYETTQGQWTRLTGLNPIYYKLPGKLAPSLVPPVEQVSWFDCTRELQRLGLALPSEAQWEYGARAGTGSVWWTGNERDSLRGAANLADQAAARAGAPWPDIMDWPELDDGFPGHAPVDRFAPNAFGLHNVHGNVFEWCLDGYFSDFYERPSPKDPVSTPEGSSGRVYRGGGFAYAAPHARSAFRSDVSPSFAGLNLGARPARAVAP